MLVATQRGEGWLRGVVRAAGSASERGRALELLDFVGISAPRGRARRQPLVRPAQAARARLAARRRPRGAAARRAGRRRQPDADQPARRAHPRAQRRRQDVPRRRAQHGVRDVAVRRGHRAQPGPHARLGNARRGPRRPAPCSTPTSATTGVRGRDRRRRSCASLASGRRSPAPAAPAPLLSITRHRRRLRRRRHPQGRLVRRARGRDHLHRRPQRRRASRRCSPPISGLLRPRSGEIRLRGEAITGLSPGQILARGVSLVPQAHSLFPQMTVRENVEMGAFTIRDRALVARAPRGRGGALPDRPRARRARRPGASPAASSGSSSSPAA